MLLSYAAADAPGGQIQKESVERIVYLGEALECPYQINNTPHLYGDSASARYAKPGDG